MGVNTPFKVVVNLYKSAGIPGIFTNHSLRRGTRTILSNAGFGSDTVAKKTGHVSRSEMDYLHLNRNMQAAMSDSLNFCSASTSRNEVHQPTNFKSEKESQLIQQGSEEKLGQQTTLIKIKPSHQIKIKRSAS